MNKIKLGMYLNLVGSEFKKYFNKLFRPDYYQAYDANTLKAMLSKAESKLKGAVSELKRYEDLIKKVETTGTLSADDVNLEVLKKQVKNAGLPFTKEGVIEFFKRQAKRIQEDAEKEKQILAEVQNELTRGKISYKRVAMAIGIATLIAVAIYKLIGKRKKAEEVVSEAYTIAKAGSILYEARIDYLIESAVKPSKKSKSLFDF